MRALTGRKRHQALLRRRVEFVIKYPALVEGCVTRPRIGLPLIGSGLIGLPVDAVDKPLRYRVCLQSRKPGHSTCSRGRGLSRCEVR